MRSRTFVLSFREGVVAAPVPGVHLHHQEFFVVGPVEDTNLSSPWEFESSPPEKVMVDLTLIWYTKRGDPASLRVHPGHHVPDNPILPCGVHSLKDDQDRIVVARPENLLGLCERYPAGFEQILCPFLHRLPSRCLLILARDTAGINPFQVHFFPGRIRSFSRYFFFIMGALPHLVVLFSMWNAAP